MLIAAAHVPVAVWTIHRSAVDREAFASVWIDTHVRPCFVAVTLPPALRVRVFAATATMFPVICCESIQVVVFANIPSLVFDHKACATGSKLHVLQPIVFVARVNLHESSGCVYKTPLDASLL